jgi:hypothetical protein
MSAIKIIICSTIGALIALSIMKVMPNLNAQQLLAYFPEKAQAATAKNTLNTLTPQAINFTIKNGSNNKLTCVKSAEGGKTVTFLVLNQHEMRSYENIPENEYIGCQLGIDGASSTFLTWFNVKNENYTMLLTRVPCKVCSNGETERWGTVIMTGNGEMLPQSN